MGTGGSKYKKWRNIVKMLRHNQDFYNILLFFTIEDFKHLYGRYGNTCTGAEDCCNTCLVKEVVVLSGDYTTGGYDDILTTKLLELFDNLRNQSLVTCCK